MRSSNNLGQVREGQKAIGRTRTDNREFTKLVLCH